MNRIYYQDGSHYKLVRPYKVQTGITPPEDILGPFITLTKLGLLTLDVGFGWNGISGAVDTPSGMRASCAHDGLYRLMRLGLLDRSCQAQADELYHTHCLEDDMIPTRADIHYGILKLVGDESTDPANVQEVLVAPRLRVVEDDVVEW